MLFFFVKYSAIFWIHNAFLVYPYALPLLFYLISIGDRVTTNPRNPFCRLEEGGRLALNVVRRR